MADLTPSQLKIRSRVESAIKLATPVLNAVLEVGDRVSRIVAPNDHEYYPSRALEKADPAAAPKRTTGD